MLGAALIGLVFLQGAPREGLPAGRFAPLFGLEAAQVDLPVAAFSLDVRPVTRAQFARFLSQQPQWSRARVNPRLADTRYLTGFERLQPSDPVVEVSYFAARAYCQWAHARLPTTLEWEYAAAADETMRDASRNPAHLQRILDWYAKASSPDDLHQRGSPRNVYGIEALHGLVWEWTEDFNGQVAVADSRGAERNANYTCGGEPGTNRREEYAAFMRYALRSSLTPRAALPNLGFRCASGASQ